MKDEFAPMLWLLVLAPLLAFVGFALTRKSPPPLSKAFASGCYKADRAPNVVLDATGMRIQQARFPHIGFHLERQKTGIALAAEAPIRADPVGDVYRYSISPRGIGLYLRFYRVENGRAYWVMDERNLEYFEMLARDGQSLAYRRYPMGDCAIQ